MSSPLIYLGASQQCTGGGIISADHWTAASDLLNHSFAETTDDGELALQPLLSMAQHILGDFYQNLESCIEGSVSVILRMLPVLDRAEGDSMTLEVVKHLHHYLSSGVELVMPPSSWQQHWLGAVAAMVRFTYLRWVNVPQTSSDVHGVVAPTKILLDTSVLSRHHEFMFRTTVNEFVKSGVYDLTIAENSVLFSEAFAFMSFCRLYDVDLILESGVYRGFSSEVWSLFAKDVVAIDLFPAPEIFEVAKQRLKHRTNVRIIQGNGKVVLPQVLDAAGPERRAAVFIDGPKGELAIRLASTLRKHPKVAFVAMHDMAPYRSALREEFGAYFFSDEAWFQKAYGHLDAPFKMQPDLQAGGTMAFLS